MSTSNTTMVHLRLDKDLLTQCESFIKNDGSPSIINWRNFV